MLVGCGVRCGEVVTKADDAGVIRLMEVVFYTRARVQAMDISRPSMFCNPALVSLRQEYRRFEHKPVTPTADMFNYPHEMGFIVMI